ncbi:MAG TPA: Spy/CpxP family protein refolding chaperone [Roseiarcus sp.]|nr:Spy/CpxP family protein refolding chaperone [Roseiarcus sp.]
MTSRYFVALAAGAAFACALALGPLGLSAQQSDSDERRADDSGQMQRRLTPEDRQAFMDARIAAVHAGLELTPDQEKLWPPVEKAVRDAIGQMREAMQKMKAARGEDAKPDPIAHLRAIAERSAAISQNLTKIADAAAPLYASLTDDQKWRLHALMRAIHMRMGMGMMRQGMGEWRGGEGGWRRGGDGEGRRWGEWRRGDGERRQGSESEEDDED